MWPALCVCGGGVVGVKLLLRGKMAGVRGRRGEGKERERRGQSGDERFPKTVAVGPPVFLCSMRHERKEVLDLRKLQMGAGCQKSRSAA